MNFNKDSDDIVKKHYQIIADQVPNDSKYTEVYFRLMNFELHDKNFQSAKVYLDKLKVLGSVEYGVSLNQSDRLIASGMLKEYTASLQSQSATVLAAIKRRNITDQQLDRIKQLGEERGFAIHTELITPLPGETVDSITVKSLIPCSFGPQWWCITLPGCCT